MHEYENVKETDIDADLIEHEIMQSYEDEVSEYYNSITEETKSMPFVILMSTNASEPQILTQKKEDNNKEDSTISSKEEESCQGDVTNENVLANEETMSQMQTTEKNAESKIQEARLLTIADKSSLGKRE